ncbi:MAG: undecaprenyl-diphosphatase UppP [Anaerolineales bacterium]
MTLFQSIILGIIQGSTEFIPVSSSGHLVLAPHLFGWSFSQKEAFVFDVLAQVATLMAVLIYFRKDLLRILKASISGLIEGKPFKNKHSLLGWLLLLSTFPAGAIGLLFKNTFEKAFSNPQAASLFLIGTALLLFSAEMMTSRSRTLDDVSWADALWIGLFQTLALFPGISRSGSTISGGMFRRLNRESAAHFSFLMSVPIMIASGFLAVYDLIRVPGLIAQLPVYFAGFLTAALVGYFVIHWLLSYLSNKSLIPFAIYCVLVGLLFLVFI